MDQLLLRIPEVCEVLQVGRSKLYTLLDQPDGLRTVRIGKSVRVSVEEVRQFVDRQMTLQDKAA